MPTILLALALGVALGALLQRSALCTMGALSDAFLFGSARRLRVLALALAVAIAGVHAAALAGAVVIDARALQLGPRIDPLAALLGGVAFGFGMVLAGGCPSRGLVRAAEGDGRAALVAALTATGVVTWAAFGPPNLIDGPFLALGRVRLLASPGTLAGSLLAAAAVAALLVWALRGATRPGRGATLGGALLGAAVTAAWLLTAPAATVTNVARTGLNLVTPAPELVTLLALGGPVPPGPVLVLGLLAGAAASAALGGRLRWAWFTDRADLTRHLAGGVLMGAGGGLTLGCTLGHGLSGLAVLAPVSLLVTLGLAAGTRWALALLTTGTLLPLRARRT